MRYLFFTIFLFPKFLLAIPLHQGSFEREGGFLGDRMKGSWEIVQE